jgi:hypothetical protein
MRWSVLADWGRMRARRISASWRVYGRRADRPALTAARGGEGVGDDLLGLAADCAGSGSDEQVEALDGPVRDVEPGDFVRGDVGRAEGVEVEVAELLVEGSEDCFDGADGDGGGRGHVGELGEGAEAGTGLRELLAGLGRGICPVDREVRGVEVVEGAAVGTAGDVALVAGDALEAPEDEGDALGEIELDLADGCEAGDGAGVVLVPGGVTLQAVDDGGGGVETVAGGILADDGLALGSARAGRMEGVAAVGGALPGRRHGWASLVVCAAEQHGLLLGRLYP